MLPISVVNGPIHNDIRLPECFIGCYRRLGSRVWREGKEREKKKNNEEKRERRGNACEIFFQKVIRSILFPRSHPYPTHSFLFFLFFFFSAHFSLSCPHNLNACNRLNASVFCFLCFLKPYFLI